MGRDLDVCSACGNEWCTGGECVKAKLLAQMSTLMAKWSDEQQTTAALASSSFAAVRNRAKQECIHDLMAVAETLK